MAGGGSWATLTRTNPSQVNLRMHPRAIVAKINRLAQMRLNSTSICVSTRERYRITPSDLKKVSRLQVRAELAANALINRRMNKH